MSLGRGGRFALTEPYDRFLDSPAEKTLRYGRGEIVTKRVLLALLLIAATWGFTNQLQGKDRAPETELVFLYHSGTKGETDECG